MLTSFLRRSNVAGIVAAAAVVASLAAAPAASADNTSESTTGDRSDRTASNKALVRYVYDQLFNKGNLSVIDAFIAPNYIQHSPALADGPEAFRQHLIALHANFPQSHHAIVRVLAEGDLVLVHGNAVQVPGTKGQSVMDVFRVAGTKIVEHWDVVQSVPDSTASGADMFTTLSEPRLNGPDPLASTIRSERIAVDYFTRMSEDHDLTAIDHYLAEPYYQHDPNLPHGVPAAKAAYAYIFKMFPEFTASSLKIIADGDLVAVRYHYKTSPTDRGQAIVDMFRVRNGKIVEHWDVAQDVPATSANGNTMF
ncbi:nuclear transport factor 2 family protein [Pendulispora brunnea]|uniref:Nuclear transport factor 2 family protein n=1 Tax=Pendulispora brunnea TaxID=2905690 RepID=A0ABZ2KA91_9BACT